MNDNGAAAAVSGVFLRRLPEWWTAQQQQYRHPHQQQQGPASLDGLLPPHMTAAPAVSFVFLLGHHDKGYPAGAWPLLGAWELFFEGCDSSNAGAGAGAGNPDGDSTAGGSTSASMHVTHQWRALIFEHRNNNTMEPAVCSKDRTPWASCGVYDHYTTESFRFASGMVHVMNAGVEQSPGGATVTFLSDSTVPLTSCSSMLEALHGQTFINYKHFQEPQPKPQPPTPAGSDTRHARSNGGGNGHHYKGTQWMTVLKDDWMRIWNGANLAALDGWRGPMGPMPVPDVQGNGVGGVGATPWGAPDEWFMQTCLLRDAAVMEKNINVGTTFISWSKHLVSTSSARAGAGAAGARASAGAAGAGAAGAGAAGAGAAGAAGNDQGRATNPVAEIQTSARPAVLNMAGFERARAAGYLFARKYKGYKTLQKQYPDLYVNKKAWILINPFPRLGLETAAFERRVDEAAANDAALDVVRPLDQAYNRARMKKRVHTVQQEGHAEAL